MDIGFIGLGSMGRPMAGNLVKAGHSLRVYSRTHSRAEALSGSGVHVVDSPAETCAAGLVMSMVSDDHAVKEIVFGEKGVLGALPKGGVHVCLSTISPSLSRELAEAHRGGGQSYVAAPVFGRPDAAEAARLVVVAAGPSEAIERSRPALEALGRKLFVVGADPASANTVKLAGNFLIASMLETLGEALALLRKSQVDPAAFLEIVNGSLFQSPIYENYGKIMLAQRYEPAGFRLRLGLKDVRLALAAAEEAAAPMPIAGLIRDSMLSGIAQGMGDIDWSALARIAARKAGLES